MTTPLLIKSISAPKPKKSKPAPPNPEDLKREAAQASGKFAGLLAILSEHKPGCKFGPDKVKPGHKVTFKAGTFVGAGKVAASGKHGATVEDDDARSHSIHWHEVTGHVDTDEDLPKKGAKKKGDAEK